MAKSKEDRLKEILKQNADIEPPSDFRGRIDRYLRRLRRKRFMFRVSLVMLIVIGSALVVSKLNRDETIDVAGESAVPSFKEATCETSDAVIYLKKDVTESQVTNIQQALSEEDTVESFFYLDLDLTRKSIAEFYEDSPDISELIETQQDTELNTSFVIYSNDDGFNSQKFSDMVGVEQINTNNGAERVNDNKSDGGNKGCDVRGIVWLTDASDNEVEALADYLRKKRGVEAARFVSWSELKPELAESYADSDDILDTLDSSEQLAYFEILLSENFDNPDEIKDQPGVAKLNFYEKQK